MADHLETTHSEPTAAEIADKTQAFASPPSFDSDSVVDSPPPSPPVKQPIHRVLGTRKSADVFLWRNKKASVGVLGGATVIWVFFEILEYHLLPFLCYTLMLALALSFLWSNTHILLYKSPPHLPEVRIKEEPFQQIASEARIEINSATAMLRDTASGRNVKKFLAAVIGLWVLSVVGSWCNFLSLFYMVVVLLHTVPVVYEKYEDRIDAFAKRIAVESKKKYEGFNKKVASKIPKGPLSDKKE